MGRHIPVNFRTHFQKGRFRLLTYSGRNSRREMEGEVFETGEVVAALLYDPCADAVVLIRQIRAGPLAVGFPPWTLEVVAGSVEPGESLEETLIREVREETGCTVCRYRLIHAYYPDSQALAERVILYFVECDCNEALDVAGCPGDCEDIQTQVMSRDAAVRLLDGDNNMTLSAMIALHWLARQDSASLAGQGVVSPVVAADDSETA